MPAWMRPFAPASAVVEEKAWTAATFPEGCSTTLMTCPLLGEGSSVEIKTLVRLNDGRKDNVFDLAKPDTNPEVIDIVRDNVSAKELSRFMIPMFPGSRFCL